MSDAVFSLWQRRSAWSGFAQTGRFGRRAADPGVTLTPLDHHVQATIIMRQGAEQALSDAIREAFYIGLPEPGTARFGKADLIWSAPQQWLLVAPPDVSVATLAQRLDGLAAVTDQSDGRALVAISGRDARSALAKGFAIDLHPDQFKPGSAAIAGVAHLSLQLWQRDDIPTFVVAAPRGFAGSVWSWLTGAAAEYGYDVASLRA